MKIYLPLEGWKKGLNENWLQQEWAELKLSESKIGKVLS